MAAAGDRQTQRELRATGSPRFPTKKPARLASVALANKLARIIRAMMTSGEAFRKEMFEPV